MNSDDENKCDCPVCNLGRAGIVTDINHHDNGEGGEGIAGVLNPDMLLPHVRILRDFLFIDSQQFIEKMELSLFLDAEDILKLALSIRRSLNQLQSISHLEQYIERLIDASSKKEGGTTEPTRNINIDDLLENFSAAMKAHKESE